jgi:hypothetical protein
MTELFLESYGGQTTDDLLALAGRYRIDSLVLAFEEAIQRKESPSLEERYVLAIEGLEREVNNGGYAQFFLNSSREFTPVIEAALRAIDCPKTADITRDAIAAIAPQGDLSSQALEASAVDPSDAVSSALAKCDDRYFANDEAIADRLFAWIAANKSRIRVGDA